MTPSVNIQLSEIPNNISLKLSSNKIKVGSLDSKIFVGLMKNSVAMKTDKINDLSFL